MNALRTITNEHAAETAVNMFVAAAERDVEKSRPKNAPEPVSIPGAHSDQHMQDAAAAADVETWADTFMWTLMQNAGRHGHGINEDCDQCAELTCAATGIADQRHTLHSG